MIVVADFRECQTHFEKAAVSCFHGHSTMTTSSDDGSIHQETLMLESKQLKIETGQRGNVMTIKTEQPWHSYTGSSGSPASRLLT